MMKQRVIFIVWLCFLIMLEIFTNSIGPLFIIAITILLPMVTLIMNMATAKKLKVSFCFPEIGEKSQKILGNIVVKNKSLLPIFNGIAEIEFKNLLTGEEDKKRLYFSLGFKEDVVFQADFISKHCGKVQIEIKELKLYDIFSIACIGAKCCFSSATSIIPRIFHPSIMLSEGKGFKDGEEYATDRAGYDISEVYEIREYVPGDSLKSIHWRLSEKLDRLVVREGSLPLGDTVLLLMESTVTASCGMPSAEGCDAMVEVLISLSYALIRKNIKHTIGWKDEREEGLMEYTVECEEEIAEVTDKLLSLQYSMEGSSVVDICFKRIEEIQYSHVIYISSYVPDKLEVLREGCQVTALIHKETIEDGEGCGWQKPFYAETMEDDLSYILL